MKILLYNPDRQPVAPLRRMFEQHGCPVDLATDPDHCVFLSMTERYAAVIHLHGSGFEPLETFFCRWKGEGCSSYYLVLAGSQSAAERGRALALGVDSYRILPYSYSKLIAEIAAFEYRRLLKDRDSLKTGSLEIDVLSRTVLLREAPLPLTRTEFDLLSLFVRRRGSVLSRVQLWEEVWGNREYPLANTIDVHVGRLRRKLAHHGFNGLSTVHGIGYRLRSDA